MFKGTQVGVIVYGAGTVGPDGKGGEKCYEAQHAARARGSRERRGARMSRRRVRSAAYRARRYANKAA